VPFVDVLARLGQRPWFPKVLRHYVPVDRLIGRLTRGRVVGGSLAGLPSLLLTTTGRRSGLPRSTPLAYTPDGDGYVLVGSNWGEPRHPAWSMNLLDDPLATVMVRGRRIEVDAVLATGTERDRLWRLAVTQWPGYQNYADRSGRRLRVFRLEPR
jgi:deazaflavin-dependent oxidoreductase (nitroreductase family)